MYTLETVVEENTFTVTFQEINYVGVLIFHPHMGITVEKLFNASYVLSLLQIFTDFKHYLIVILVSDFSIILTNVEKKISTIDDLVVSSEWRVSLDRINKQ